MLLIIKRGRASWCSLAHVVANMDIGIHLNNIMFLQLKTVNSSSHLCIISDMSHLDLYRFKSHLPEIVPLHTMCHHNVLHVPVFVFRLILLFDEGYTN